MRKIFLFTLAISLAPFSQARDGKPKKPFPPIPPMPEVADAQAFKAPDPWQMFAKDYSKFQFHINGTDFVDQVLELCKKQVVKYGLDEIEPPDFDFEVPPDYKVKAYDVYFQGMGNLYRLGDVISKTEPLFTTFKCAFGLYNFSGEAKMHLKSGETEYPDGAASFTCKNITIYQVYRLAHASQALTLDEYETNLEECRSTIEGFGEDSLKTEIALNLLLEKFKAPAITIFNVSFKIVVNIALQASRAAIVGGVGAG